MEHAPAPLLAHIAGWSDPARDALWICRTLYHQVAEETGVGRLDETLKWQQPAWRPIKPRTGSTLRMGWTPASPDHLSFYVDCKTDLAARVRDIYPDLPVNDGQRHIAMDISRPLDQDTVAHLAQMTFTYHMSARKKAAVG